MKKGLCLVVCVLLSGLVYHFASKGTEDIIRDINATSRKTNTIQVPGGEYKVGNVDVYEVFLIDGCQYIRNIRPGNSDGMTHKGNCTNVFHNK